VKIVAARGLARDPIDAAKDFLDRIVPQVRSAIGAGELSACVLFDSADYTHRAWRLAAVQSLAREAAPGRVNAIAAADDASLRAAIDFLETATGVTGQYLPLNGQDAGNPLK
jgi:hypothetical protein